MDQCLTVALTHASAAGRHHQQQPLFAHDAVRFSTVIVIPLPYVAAQERRLAVFAP